LRAILYYSSTSIFRIGNTSSLRLENGLKYFPNIELSINPAIRLTVYFNYYLYLALQANLKNDSKTQTRLISAIVKLSPTANFLSLKNFSKFSLQQIKF
jgi:hypothetical protein